MSHVSEIARVLSLPTREPPTSLDPGPGAPPDLTATYARPGGSMALRPVQSWALSEVEEVGGIAGPIGVGAGKTLISLLAPLAYYRHTGRPVRALLLIPAHMRGTLEAKIEALTPHWYLPNTHPDVRLQVLTYSALSRAEFATALDRLRPNLIIADEAHKLRRFTAARTLRVARLFAGTERPAFVPLSGTLLSDSVRDTAHLFDWALGEGSPLPREISPLRAWGAVVDPEGNPQAADFAAIRPLVDQYGPQPPSPRVGQGSAREALHNRIRLTPGIVATRESDIGVSLTLRRRDVETPPEVEAMLAHVADYWETPAGEPLESAALVAELEREILQGFYYEPVWPAGEPDRDWLEARRGWGRAVRETVSDRLPGLDTELLIRRATELGAAPSALCREAWDSWATERLKPPPPRRVVWLSYYLLADALAWAAQRPGRILWYHHGAVGEALQGTGITVYGPGVDPPLPGQPGGGVSCAMSMAHGEGKDLYDWRESLVLSPPSSASRWEQLLGRTHRTGQKSHEVTCAYYAHHDRLTSALATAMARARFFEETTGQRQRLLYADHITPRRGAKRRNRGIGARP